MKLKVMGIQIFYDALQEVEWFVSLDSRLESCEQIKIKDRGQNEQAIINDLILYDRPDIILLENGVPKLVVEKTEEVPSGHNVGQRIARLARGVELGCPIVKFFPFVAMKHGRYANKCYVRPNIFDAFFQMKKFHGVHALAIEWRTDSTFELIRDGSENHNIAQLLKEFLDNNFEFRGTSMAERIESSMLSEYEIRVNSSVKYRRLAPSLSLEKTSNLVSNISGILEASEIDESFNGRQKTLVYTMEMTPEKCRREDPYTGNQFIYDYCYCRNGPLVENRHTNFALNFPLLTIERWLEANPLDPSRKSFLWYALADLMIFNDGVLWRANNFGR